ncbi:MAG: hypothetical protein GY927_03410 [bacterium]|nr:hypothetical protein [bacterium]
MTKEKDEALMLLTKFYSEIKSLSEKQVDDIFLRLKKISPDPEISDYVFYPPNGVEMTPEEIVEKAFSYKAIQL